MHLLILGGTQFVGRHLVEAALASGHRVTVLTRGVTPDPLPAGVERVRGDRDLGAAGLAALAGRTFDACLDVSGYTPAQVRPAVEWARGRVARSLFVSSRAVYVEPCPLPITEAHAVWPPAAEDVTEIDGATYGPLKVACERIVTAVFGEAATILRPQVVAGPHDVEPRYPSWADRAARGGPIVAPGDGTDHVQVIDARDLARFAVLAVERGLSGVFNLAGPRLTWAEFLRAAGAGDVRWVDAAALRAALPDLPEWRMHVPDGDPHAGRVHVDASRALAAGLTLTDPVVTARDTRDWARAAGLVHALTPELEAELIARFAPTPPAGS